MKPQRIPKPHLFKSRSWGDIARSFAELAEANSYFQPMSQLVSEIATSKYAIGLFPIKSMHDLWISQSEEFEMWHEALLIRFDVINHKFLFQYVENPYVKNPWQRECPEATGFQTFERFLEMKKWFLKFPEE
jgi:hypothetical protein